MEWKTVKLGDVCEIFGRIGFRGYTNNDFVTSPKDGAITLSPTNIVDGELNLSKCSYINWDKYNESPEIMVKENDILLSKTGTIGRTAMVRRVDHPMTINPQFVLLKKCKISPSFLSYYLKTPKFQGDLYAITVGSVIATLSQKNLGNIDITIPDEESQNKISDILSSLDAKIENNNRINANLEAQAQALYKSWFVDFEPWGGKMPEDWKIGTLDEIGDVIGGSTPSKARPDFYTTDGIAWLTPKDLSVSNRKFTSRGEIDITQSGYDSCSTKLIPRGSVLFSSRAPIGYITIAKNDICTNQGFKSVVPKLAGTAYIYYYLKVSTIEIENKATGSTFKEASGSLMKSLPVVIASKYEFSRFEDLMKPILNKQEALEEESQRLAQLRDTLLPKLMRGEIEL